MRIIYPRVFYLFFQGLRLWFELGLSLGLVLE